MDLDDYQRSLKELRQLEASQAEHRGRFQQLRTTLVEQFGTDVVEEAERLLETYREQLQVAERLCREARQIWKQQYGSRLTGSSPTSVTPSAR